MAFTAAGAQWVYRGDLIPEFYGNVFVAEPSANFVRRSILTAEHGTLQARGVEVGELLRWDGVPPMFSFDDPDGNRFYIVEAMS